MAEFNPEPLVWEDDRVRFTVDRIIGIPVVTLLGDKTDAQLLIATRVPADLMNRHRLIPLNDAGFQWLAAEIRLALTEARVEELEGAARGLTRTWKRTGYGKASVFLSDLQALINLVWTKSDQRGEGE